MLAGIDPGGSGSYQHPMTEMALEIEEKGEDDTPLVAPPTPPRRGPGHRGQDMRDTMAEMAAKAHEISLEAGSKMAAAMKDVIGAAAGYSAFAIESARDLVQYMVRRGQMTQDEADKLIREAEAAHEKSPKTLIPKPELKPEVKKANSTTIFYADSTPAVTIAPPPAAPAKAHAVPAPAKAAVSSAPVKAAAAKEPVKAAAAKEPVKASAAKEPGKSAAPKEPVKAIAVKMPVKGATVASTVKAAPSPAAAKSAAPAPLKTAVAPAPMKVAAAPAPVKVAAANEPLKGTVVKTAAKAADKEPAPRTAAPQKGPAIPTSKVAVVVAAKAIAPAARPAAKKAAPAPAPAPAKPAAKKPAVAVKAPAKKR